MKKVLTAALALTILLSVSDAASAKKYFTKTTVHAYIW